MKERGICVLAARPDASLSRSLKDLSFEVAKFAGFQWVRFNPDVNYLGKAAPMTLVPELPDNEWRYFDAHFDRCRRHELKVLLTLAKPPNHGDNPGWVSTDNGTIFNWATGVPAPDEAGVIFLYKQILNRAVNVLGWPEDQIYVEIANEASRRAFGGTGTTENTGEIQPAYVISLGQILRELRAAFPKVTYLSPAMSFTDFAVNMANPWMTEIDFLVPTITSSPPPCFSEADILNLHLYWDQTKNNAIMTKEEYRANLLWLFDQFDAYWLSKGAAGRSILQKPIWVTEHGTSFSTAGMEVVDYKNGNEAQVAMFRTMAFQVLVEHPRIQKCFLYNAINELAADDFRGGVGVNNYGLLRFGTQYTQSYKIMAASNGVKNPAIPAGSQPATEFTITGY